MLREGDYGAFYQRACERAPGDNPPGLRPLEFTHVMIDEAGQARLTPAVLCTSWCAVWSAKLCTAQCHCKQSSRSRRCFHSMHKRSDLWSCLSACLSAYHPKGAIAKSAWSNCYSPLVSPACIVVITILLQPTLKLFQSYLSMSYHMAILSRGQSFTLLVCEQGSICASAFLLMSLKYVSQMMLSRCRR